MAEPRKIHITRKGQQFGPYPEDIAEQYLSEGTLLETDLAWHVGAESWKPLGELLAGEQETKAAEPPPTPAATTPPKESPAGPPPDTAVHISREGEKHGPYKYETAKIHLEGGQLLPTDSAWHEGMDEWKSLGEVYPQVVPGSTQSITATPSGPATYTPAAEEEMKEKHLMYIGFLMIVGVVLPQCTIGISMLSFKLELNIEFPNFLLSEKNFEQIVSQLGPLVVGITAVAMALSARDPLRCSVVLGLAALTYLMAIKVDNPLTVTDGFGVSALFFLGWLCLIMGCRVRHMRPTNLPAYIVSLVGAGFLFLFWIVPGNTGGVPLAATFKMFDGSKVAALGMFAFMGMQIAGGVICCVSTRSKPTWQVAQLCNLAMKLVVGSILILLAFGVLEGLIELHEGAQEANRRYDGFFAKLKFFIFKCSTLLKILIPMLATLLVYPICASDLMTRLMRR